MSYYLALRHLFLLDPNNAHSRHLCPLACNSIVGITEILTSNAVMIPQLAKYPVFWSISGILNHVSLCLLHKSKF